MNAPKKDAANRTGGPAHDHAEARVMKVLIRMASVIYGVITACLVAAALVLIGIAVHVGYRSVAEQGLSASGAQGVIESIGLIAVAVVAVEIAQTIAEEEIIRKAHVSGPTRVRRFMSRFMVVIVVALSIEGMVATFKALHENLADLPRSASLVVAIGVLLAGWGVFIRLNRSAEELEPETMEQAKQEDEKLE